MQVYRLSIRVVGVRIKKTFRMLRVAGEIEMHENNLRLASVGRERVCFSPFDREGNCRMILKVKEC
jgi:hypothetical protein